MGLRKRKSMAWPGKDLERKTAPSHGKRKKWNYWELYWSNNVSLHSFPHDTSSARVLSRKATVYTWVSWIFMEFTSTSRRAVFITLKKTKTNLTRTNVSKSDLWQPCEMNYRSTTTRMRSWNRLSQPPSLSLKLQNQRYLNPVRWTTSIFNVYEWGTARKDWANKLLPKRSIINTCDLVLDWEDKPPVLVLLWILSWDQYCCGCHGRRSWRCWN